MAFDEKACYHEDHFEPVAEGHLRRGGDGGAVVDGEAQLRAFVQFPILLEAEDVQSWKEINFFPAIGHHFLTLEDRDTTSDYRNYSIAIQGCRF